MSRVLLCMPHQGQTRPPPPPDVSEEGNPRAVTGDKGSVLVVDDDQDIRDGLAGILADAGYEVDTAFDGLDGLVKALRGPRPDVIILDVSMPTLSGIGMVSALEWSQLADVPILIISAYPTYREDIQHKDRYVFIDKPPKIDVILDHVARAVLRGRSFRDD